ncbi:hypothetical protein HDU98_003129 [Podochytrium sp. JEL0797]|nr:hypothetical protein HDU98_003129 [Podochytrium sp. JEL0797]
MTLLSAVQSGSLSLVETALLNSTFADSDASACLFSACAGNDGAIVRLLLRHFGSASSLATAAFSGNTLLHVACAANAFDAAEALLHEPSCLVNATNTWKETPLHLAAASGHKRVVLLLLSFNSDTSARDKWARTPARVAREHGYDVGLVDSEIDPDSPSPPVSTPHPPTKQLESLTTDLMAALAKRNESNAKVTVKHMFDERIESVSTTASNVPPPPPPPPLHAPVPPPPPAPVPPPPMQSPPIRVNPRLPSQFTLPTLKPTPKPFNPPSTPLSPTTRSPHTISATTTTTTTTLKSISSQLEYPASISHLTFLLAQPAIYSPTAKDMFGFSALHKLASWNQPDLLRLLLDVVTEEDVNQKASNKDAFTPLHCALDSGAWACVDVLVENGRCDFGVVDGKGVSCTVMAFGVGYVL